MKEILGENVLVFYSSENSQGKQDATGAFIPEAKKFASYYKVPDSNMISVRCKSLSKDRRRELVLKRISEVDTYTPLKMVAFFGHGWPSGIQFGFSRQHIHDFAASLSTVSTDDLVVVLYACLTAENDIRDTDTKRAGPGTDGGFSDLLRDNLVACGTYNGWVDAHKTAGHTSWNPYVIRFLCEDVSDEEYGAEGGSWIVEPGSSMWKKWVRLLRDETTQLRYRFPTMTETEIYDFIRNI